MAIQALRYRGVHWANNMFVVTHFDKHGTKEWLTLGKFTSADEAARCYDRHVKATDGAKAKLNFPESASLPAGGIPDECHEEFTGERVSILELSMLKTSSLARVAGGNVE